MQLSNAKTTSKNLLERFDANQDVLDYFDLDHAERPNRGFKPVNGDDQDKGFKLIGAAGFSPVHEWTEESYLAFLAAHSMQVEEHRMFRAKQPLCVAICRID